MGRALVYAADRAGEPDEIGMPHLKTAAEMSHTQAMFVYGLMHKRHGELCASEPWTRAATDKGLKSARIAYVNDYLAGSLDECDDVAGKDQMAAYLEGARSQVAGYYENMLLDALGRQLEAVSAQ